MEESNLEKRGKRKLGVDLNANPSANYSKNSSYDEDWQEKNDEGTLNENTSNINSFMPCTDDMDMEKVMQMTFDCVEDAEIFYNAYAKSIGFSIRKRDVRRTGDIITAREWVCSKNGFRDTKSFNREELKREPKALTRCGCKAQFRVSYDKKKQIYIVANFVKEHNHDLMNQDSVIFLYSHRNLRDGDIAESCAMSRVGIRTSQIMSYFANKSGGYRDVGFTVKDLYNHLNKQQRCDIVEGDAEAALAYLHAKADVDPMFAVEYDVDNEKRLRRLLWSDSKSRYDYKLFGDVLVLDSTYRTNSYHKPLVVLAGVNNHFMTTIFACALLSDESVETYNWVFRTFLSIMENKNPISVVTDGDKAIGKAIKDVIPEARHRLCSWHLQRNVVKNVHISGVTQNFVKCTRKECMEDEFDDCWRNFVTKFDLESNDWVNDTYSIRDKWATAYLRGHFFGGMCSTQRCEGMNSFLKKHVDQAIKLYEFIRSFELAMGWLRHKEAEQDTICKNNTPIMKTQLKYLEAHAANIFTRKVFYKVREEIEKVAVLSFTHSERDEFNCKYSMTEYGKSSSWNVTINLNNLEMRCSCLQLETVGWPCSHLFNVMKAENMKDIPSSCIRERWTLEAKAVVDRPYHDEIPTDIRKLACYGSLYQQCKEMCFYASQIDEGYEELTPFIATMTGRMKMLYMKRNNSSGVSASTMNTESVRKFNVRDPQNVKTKGDHATENGSKSAPKCTICRLPGHNKSTCKKKNTTKNAQSTRLSVDDEYENVSLNNVFTHDFMNSKDQTPQHQERQSLSTTYTDYMSNDLHDRNTRNESQTFTFNNSLNAQNFSYDIWNTDMLNKVSGSQEFSSVRRL